MAGKLMFKLTGGKTDKDEEYEQLKEEFLKYKKACEGVKSHSGKLYEHTISYAKRYLGFAEETEKFFEQSGGREGQGFKVMGEEIMELAKQLASAVGEVTAGVEVMINTNEGLRKRISGRDDTAVDLGYATKSKDKDSKHSQKYEEAKQKYEEVNSKLKIDLKAALTDGQPKFREHYQRLIAAQQAFYKGLERAATRLAELEERYGYGSTRETPIRETPIRETPIREIPIKSETPKAVPKPISPPPSASRGVNNVKISIVNGRKLKAADLNGKSDPYCRIKCGSKFEKTRHKNNTLNPDWNEDFVFPVDLSQDTIIISLYDHDDIGSDDSLGSVNVSHYELQKLVRGQYTPMTLKVDGGKGEINIGLTAMDFGTAAPLQPSYPPPVATLAPAPVSNPSPRAPPVSIKISIIHARKIKAADFNGKSDPYVRVQCGHKYEKTKRKDSTLNPDWNEDFVMNVEPTRDFIILSLFDHDTLGKDDSLGTVTIPPHDIQKLVRGQRTPMTLKIDGGKGDLHIALTAMDFGLAAPLAPPPVAERRVSNPPPPQPYHVPPPIQTPLAPAPYSPPSPTSMPSIKVSVIHARKIKAADLNGKSDPYVRIQCGHKFEKTKRKDNTLNPDWNEDFVFPLDITRDYIIFSLFDHDAIGKDDSLGTVTISPHDVAKLIRGQRTPMTKNIDGGKGDLHIALTAMDFGLIAPSAPLAPPPVAERRVSNPPPPQPYHVPPPIQTPLAPAPYSPPSPVSGGGVPSIKVSVIHARKIKAADFNGKSDPYVRIQCGHKFEKTRRKDSTLNPDWNEDFVFGLDPTRDYIIFSLFDHDAIGKDDSLGTVTISPHDLAKLVRSQRTPFTMKIDGGKGELTFALTAMDFGISNTPIPAPVPAPYYPPPEQYYAPPPPQYPPYDPYAQQPYYPPPPQESYAPREVQPPPPVIAQPPPPQPMVLPPRPVYSAPGTPPGLTEAEAADLRARFAAADRDGSGKLDMSEVETIIIAVFAGRMQEANCRRLAAMQFRSFDKDRSGSLDLNEFFQLYVSVRALGGLAPLETSPPPATPPRPEAGPPVIAPRPSYSRPSQAGAPPPANANAAGQPPPPLPARTSQSGAGAPPATNSLPLPPRSSNAGAPSPSARPSPKQRGMPPPAGLTDADVEDAQSRFRQYDKDASGKLDLEETIALLTDLMRGKLQEGNLRRLASMHFQSADKDRSGSIDFQEFLQLYAQMRASAPR